MNTHRPTQADETAAILQDAARLGVPVMIPGAYARRAGPPAAASSSHAGDPVSSPPVAASDRTRLEYAREGGGSPGERTGVRPRTLLSKLWQTVLRPLDLSNIWREPLPRSR
jgi:hypothetical protein